MWHYWKLMLLTGIYLVNAQCSRHMPVMTNFVYSGVAASSRMGSNVRDWKVPVTLRHSGHTVRYNNHGQQ